MENVRQKVIDETLALLANGPMAYVEFRNAYIHIANKHDVGLTFDREVTTAICDRIDVEHWLTDKGTQFGEVKLK